MMESWPTVKEAPLGGQKDGAGTVASTLIAYAAVVVGLLTPFNTAIALNVAVLAMAIGLVYTEEVVLTGPFSA